jgi:hypothetical protein
MANEDLSFFQPLADDVERMRKSNLTAAIGDVDRIIELLEAARKQISEGTRGSILFRVCLATWTRANSMRAFIRFRSA